MKNLNEFKAFALSKGQMNAIAGGTSKEEYCKALHDNYMANGSKWSDSTKTGFAVGWTQAGCNTIYQDICF